jgi:hypothetical protein
LASSKVRFGWQPKPTREPRALTRPETYSLHIRVRAFTVFGDETVDPRRDNGQRYRAELEHGIVESFDVEFRSEGFLRFFTGTHDRELAQRAQALEVKRRAANAS